MVGGFLASELAARHFFLVLPQVMLGQVPGSSYKNDAAKRDTKTGNSFYQNVHLFTTGNIIAYKIYQ